MMYGVVIVNMISRNRARSIRRRVDDAINEQSLTMRIEAMVIEVTKSVAKASNSYIRRRIFNQWLKTLQESEIVDRIDSVVLDFLPEMPRASKRLLNQVHLMMVVAISRELFEVEDKAAGSTRPEWLGKWLVLRERWPSVADFLSRNQATVRKFERTKNLMSLLRSCHIGDLDDIADLKRLLNSPPPLGDIHELTLLGGTPPDVRRPTL